MNVIFLMAISGVLGIAIGVGGTLGFRASERSRRRMLEEPTISDSTSKVLTVLKQASVVVDATNDVDLATPKAFTMGLVRSHTLLLKELFPVLDRVRRDGVIEELELDIEKEQGEKAVYGFRVAPLDLDFILIIAEDHTDSKQEENNRKEFVNNISMQLQSPVKRLSEIYEEVKLVSGNTALHAEMGEEVAHLQALTTDVMQLSKLQNTQADELTNTFSVNTATENAVNSSRKAASKKGIELKFVAGNYAQCVGDVDLLSSAIKNLIDNAVAYSPEGTTVGISTKAHDGEALITVVDRGIGLTEEQQERIFDRFYRADGDPHAGTGLGLSIVKRIVNLHGGDISVWSRPGKGSTFTIKLPIASKDSLAAE